MKNDAELTPIAHGALSRCFGCGQQNPTGLRLKFFTDAGGNIVCRLRVAQRFEGPPGCVHGGVIATLLDEAMSKANRARGVVAMTRQMEVEYLRPVRLRTSLTLTGRHVEAHGRKHQCEAQITDAEGTVLARAKALFIAVDPARLAQAAGR
ncbi:PaaI family thioesterase [Paracidobacterium acidisoli]|uniref:Acyl-coenzyme A thioesterase THEM4 n=1 Tax=Paracidobacterium acidisoli TaxID=2303751 RepID=A0A372IRQ5_9BACT|nr:PaaI family thioesterase [Paracidobacterium acidisoli]MBT9330469.1 PaaI family thioesterase [Paracidobacterium acidisoli]